MKPLEVEFGSIRLVTVAIISGEITFLGQDMEVSLRQGPGPRDFLLRAKGNALMVKGRRDKDDALLSEVLGRNLPRLVRVLAVEPKASEAVLQIHEFALTRELPALDIGLDEEGVRGASRMFAGRRRAAMSVQDVLQALGEEFLLPETSTEIRAFALLDERSGSMALVGPRFIASLETRPAPDGLPVMMLTKLGRRRDDADRVVMIRGEIAFKDVTNEGRMRALAASELERIAQDPRAYFSVWDQYGQQFERMFRQRAEAFGVLRYTNIERLGSDRVRLELEGAPEEISASLALLTSRDSLAVSANRSDLVSEDYAEEMLAAELGYQRNSRGRMNRPRLPKAGPILPVDPSGESLMLKIEGNLPREGFVAIDTQGEEQVVKRRKEARAKLLSGQNPLPTLGMLIEGKSVPITRYPAVKALSPAVRKKIFPKHPPTTLQEKAIEVALNTPDIAVIQGPPGTGKTTVITAIVERLNELLGRDGDASGQILVSGFQHDAVNNALARIDILGLPSPKFGGKRDDEGAENELDLWARRLTEEVRRNAPELVCSERHRRLMAAVDDYFRSPWPAERVPSMLREIAVELRTETLDPLADELEAMASDLAEELNRALDPEAEYRLRAIWALRVTPESFADDGAASAFCLLQLLPSRWLAKPEVSSLLEMAAAWSMNETPPFLGQLRSLRRQLLLQFSPPPPTWMIGAQARQDVAKLLASVREQLDRAARTSLPPAHRVIADYVFEVETDQVGLRDAIRRYTKVYGATCQQAAGSDIAGAKGKSLEYDTVLIDEAARANPLDLMIPMAQGRRRIILVGDHKQLPHLIEQEIADRIDAEAESGVRDTLQESLFQKLFEDLKRLEESDGIRRTATLGEQYRMHPSLGELISKWFYEKLDSPLPAERFAHTLPGLAGKPAAWLTVSSQEGGESRDGTSRRRRAEARAIAAHLKRMLDDPAGAHLTFGVITFYKAQVEAIQKALLDVGVFVPDSHGVRMADAYRDHRDESGRLTGEERLRIGTVDAFQGREFDVVYLSIVRCNRLPDHTAADWIKKYGHLTSPNRLCVSMSRQRRLLIMVGDPELLASPKASEAIGPIVDFYEMCKNDATIL